MQERIHSCPLVSLRGCPASSVFSVSSVGDHAERVRTAFGRMSPGIVRGGLARRSLGVGGRPRLHRKRFIRVDPCASVVEPGSGAWSRLMRLVRLFAAIRGAPPRSDAGARSFVSLGVPSWLPGLIREFRAPPRLGFVPFVCFVVSLLHPATAVQITTSARRCNLPRRDHSDPGPRSPPPPSGAGPWSPSPATRPARCRRTSRRA